MLLKGSCHCGSVRFEVFAPHPYPFLLCYCSICRKTAGGGGYAINLGADFSTLKVEGGEHVRIYRPRIRNRETGVEEISPGERHFCSVCGSALWGWDPRWPGLVHPHASAIDSELPLPPARSHMMLGSRANWVPVCSAPYDKFFDEYPDESLAEWHWRHALEQPES